MGIALKQIVQSRQFKQDLKKLKGSGRHQIDLLLSIIHALASDAVLPIKHHDHELQSNWAGYRECHIKPDWLLIYKKTDDKLILVRTGTHSELFKK